MCAITIVTNAVTIVIATRTIFNAKVSWKSVTRRINFQHQNFIFMQLTGLAFSKKVWVRYARIIRGLQQDWSDPMSIVVN